MKTTITRQYNGIEITVTRTQTVLDKNADGQKYGEEVIDLTDIVMTKDGLRLTKANSGQFGPLYPDTFAADKAAAEAGAVGYVGMGSSKVLLKQESYDLIAGMLAEIGGQEEEQEPQDDLTINPAYAHLSREELARNEREYDDIHNEGGEGFNPCRDNYWIAK